MKVTCRIARWAPAVVALAVSLPGASQEVVRVNPRPQVTLGLSADDPRYQLNGIVGAVVTPNGHIFVASGGDNRVVEFGADAQFVRAIGRPGDGPGEFRGIRTIKVLRDTLFVFDGYWQRLSAFNGEGELVGDRRLESPPERRVGRLDVFADGTWLLREQEQLTAPPPSGMSRDTITFSVADAEFRPGRLLLELAADLTIAVSYQGNAGYRFAPLGPSPRHAVFGSCLLATSGDEQEVHVVSVTGKALSDIPLPLEVARITDDDVTTWVDAMLARLPDGERTRARPLLAGLQHPSSRPLVNEIRVDPLGIIWVEEWAAPFGPSGRWVAMSWQGTALARVTLPGALRVFEIGQHHLLGAGEGPMGVETIVAHQVLRAPSAPGVPAECQGRPGASPR